MMCPECEEERKESDFINSNICYKCEFQKKLQKSKSRKTVLCKICGEECDKSRWAYCSDDCAAIGKQEQDRNYWTYKINSCSSYMSKQSFANSVNKKDRKQG